MSAFVKVIVEGNIDGGLSDVNKALELFDESISLCENPSMANMVKMESTFALTTYLCASPLENWNPDKFCSEEQYVECIKFYKVRQSRLSIEACI